MKNKRILALLLTLIICLSALPFAANAEVEDVGGHTVTTLANSTIAPKLDGEILRTVKTLYNGVISTNIKTSSSSKYDRQNFNVVGFDLSQTDLYIDVTNTRTYANQAKTTLNTVTSFNSANGEGKTAIAAINGDLWMMASAHSRVEGSGTSYGGYSDAVVTSSLTLPRGFNVYDGEIICSAYMQQETPYEGEFWSFGVTEDYVPMIGCPELEIAVTDTTKGITAEADGLNRLPANNALVVYSDKGCLNNYALSDAYEVVIDCGYDYTVEHGAKITGKVVGIYTSLHSANPTMTDNRIILTARGNKVDLIDNFKVGDTVTLDFAVTERYGRNTEGWQNVTNAVGGHMPFVVDGVKQETGTTVNYPSTIVGIKHDGSLCFIVNDGRQTSFSTGLDFNMYWDLADDFDLNTAFILDGGGSATLVELASSGYNVVNSPSDGSARSVVNSVILSYGPKRAEQGKNNIEYPDPDVDLTTLYFATDEGYDLIGNLTEAVSEKTLQGAKLTIKDFASSGNVVVSYGLPNTTSYNPNSYLADISYPSVTASDYPYAVFDMSIVSADSSIVQFQTLYFSSGSRKAAEQNTFVGFNNAFNNSGFTRYTLNPGSNSYYTGKLNTFRLGFLFPANGVTVRDGDYVYLRAIKLCKTAAEATAYTTPAHATLSFNANGGNLDQTKKYVVKDVAYGNLPTPTREGYKFDGWYTAASGGAKVTETTVTSHIGIRTLYAHWTSTSAHTHSYRVDRTTEPTCVKEGIDTYTCSCGDSYTKSVAATGVHVYGSWIQTTAPDCESMGVETRKCGNCPATETQNIPALGHTWGEWIETTAPTTEAEGVESRTCGNCGTTQTQSIPKLEVVEPDTEFAITVENYTVKMTNASKLDHIRYASGIYNTAAEIRNAEDVRNVNATIIANGTTDDIFTYEMQNGGVYSFWIRFTDGTTRIEHLDFTTMSQSVSTEGLMLTVHNLYGVKDYFVGKGTYNSYRELKNGETVGRVTATKIAGAKSFTTILPDNGDYTVCVRYDDATRPDLMLYFSVEVDMPEIEINGLQVLMSGLTDVRVIRTAPGTWETPGEVKRAEGARNIKGSALKGSDTLTLQYSAEGTYTLTLEYYNGLIVVKTFEIKQKEPTVEQNGNSVTFGDLDDMYIIRYAKGEYTTSAEIKNASGSKFKKPNSIVDGHITVDNLESGTYTFCVQYNDNSYNYYTIVVE